jgi:hypothetical protein
MNDPTGTCGQDPKLLPFLLFIFILFFLLFRVKSSGIIWRKFNFTRNSRILPYRQYFKLPADVANITLP